MDSITRQLGLLCLGVLAVALTACASNDVSQCATSGILCPAGTHCAAVQGICIADSNLCGNGDPTDPGEECDDGNTIDGDGCSHECKKETCGNGHIDFGEVCDNGPGKNGVCMGCAADCKSFEACGDGVLDTACEEVCDDHNTKDGDGCAHDCKSTEVCGNGIIDREVGEVCDDGKDKNGAPGDPCDVTCRSNRSCGNATVDKDQGEECDAGKFGLGNLTGNDDSNDCRQNCQFNRCGDGLVDKQDGPRHEQCDGGSLQPDSHNQPVATPAETLDCNIDCTTPSCGDGKVNRHFTPKDALGNPAPGPEQCDNGGANNDSAACTALCQVNVCGDHHKLIGVEACDDGGVDTSNCNANCTTPTCGDGHVNLLFTPKDALGNPAPGPEQCDNGTVAGVNQNQDSAACTSTCQINVCGDGKKLEGVEQCDSGGIDTDKCDFDCTVPVCGDGHRNMAAGEACDDGALNGTAASPNHCTQFCQKTGCGNGVVDPGEDCDAGTGGMPKNSAACNSDCTFAKCGDNFPNPVAGEACDEGAANGTLAGPTHCNQFCQFNSCGDGILEPGEQCDDGTTNGINNNHANARCNQFCKFNVCGDSDKLEGVEQCDPGKDALGNVQDTSTCDHDCTIPVCGDGVTNLQAHEECDDGPDNGKPGHCDSACKSIACGNGVVDPGEDCDDGVGGVRKNSVKCNSNCTFAQCGDGFVNDQFKPDGVNKEVCDDVDMAGAPVNGTPCDYGNPFCSRCNATCTGHITPGGPFCGDFITQSGPGMNEKCDPGTGPSTSISTDPPSRLARADSATCNIDCTLPVCGDGHLNSLALETCDDGNLNACGTCPSVTNTDCRGATPITPTQATSTILTTNGDVIGDLDTLKLDDGFGKTITLEFDLVALQDQNAVPISFAQSPATDAATIASRMVVAINTKAPAGFLITASVPTGGTTVTLTNSRKSLFGNTPITVTGLIGITGTGFTFSASPPRMTGGLAGDCLTGIGCVFADDCKSGMCSATTHQCQ